MEQQQSESRSAGAKVQDVAYKIEGSGRSVHELPSQIRPREAAERVGVENVGDDVLLALLLRSGTVGLNVVDLSQGLMRKYGSLTELAKAPEKELAKHAGIGPTKAQIIKASFELGRRLRLESKPKASRITSPADVFELLEDRVRVLNHEVFWTLLVNAKSELINKPLEITHGVLNASLVHPREVFSPAIRLGCAAIVVAHNHPSGDPTPSAEDVRVTKQLVDSGKIIDIKVLDHVVIGRDGRYKSLRELGLM
jgi:DNA repair protein RadC